MRGFPLDTVEPIVEAIGNGGLRTLEITMNTDGAENQIRRAVEVAEGSGMQIGAGTVTDESRLENALAAGASFIVTPNLNPQVIRLCQELEVPFIPGALTPTEIYVAYEAGALAAKIFPAETLGPEFVRSIKAPLPNLRVAPTGGVTVERMKDYLEAGADAFGLGSPLFPKGAVEDCEWGRIEQAAYAFHQAYTILNQSKKP
ncbi:MAG: bifunctional 4-hydroxy-2-oxoglutarate aldolase/2-dehydro-3-deoxy-phosphogluconate aldolase [Verrucomicrobia bacterium]|nr:bifunctional 4-hydroxy-2-oxoglutarate aldolase/2-dehydro-3-deoxy-phosphogluconate aldolase [Verrucomicrobiota bacterium]